MHLATVEPSSGQADFQNSKTPEAQEQTRKPEHRYYRFVRWSDEDQCYIGNCPDLYFGGVCHGDGEEYDYTELCAIVRDQIAQPRDVLAKRPEELCS